MSEYVFDHDRLDVYRLSIEYTSDAFKICHWLDGLHRHARDQWLRAAQSIPRNIAEGNGKRSLRDRARFLDIARGSALECAAIQDVLTASKGMAVEMNHELKIKLVRIVSMLTRMAMKFENISEPESAYALSSDYDYEYEHEHRLWLSTELVSATKFPEEPIFLVFEVYDEL